MITCSLWLYEIDARNLANFVSAFSENGLLYESFRRMPGHIHTDLLKGADTVSSTNRLAQMLLLALKPLQACLSSMLGLSTLRAKICHRNFLRAWLCFAFSTTWANYTPAFRPKGGQMAHDVSKNTGMYMKAQRPFSLMDHPR
ncbi:MAG: hypothetical protein ACP5M4_06940 [Acidobacteriaceae bacterium]